VESRSALADENVSWHNLLTAIHFHAKSL
jgi:hypothetical protein